MAIDLFINVACVLAEFFANDVHISRSLDTNPHGVGTDANNRDRHVITNQNLFAWLSREHQHTATPFLVLNYLPCFVLRGLNQSPPQTSLLATIGRHCHQLEYDIRRITTPTLENLVQSENSTESLNTITKPSPGKSPNTPAPATQNPVALQSKPMICGGFTRFPPGSSQFRQRQHLLSAYLPGIRAMQGK